MDPRPQHVLRRTRRCRLYLDDVQSIVDLLGGGGGDVEITVPGYGTRDGGAERLLDLKASILHEIHIMRYKPTHVAVHLTGDNGFVYGESDDPETVGVVVKVAEVLGRCRRKSTLVFNNFTTILLLLGALGVVLTAAAVSPARQHWSYAKISLLMSPFLVASTVGLVNLWQATYRRTIVVCAWRKDAPGFWKRNKDAITVAIIAAVVGAAIGAVVTKLLA